MVFGLLLQFFEIELYFSTESQKSAIPAGCSYSLGEASMSCLINSREAVDDKIDQYRTYEIATQEGSVQERVKLEFL